MHPVELYLPEVGKVYPFGLPEADIRLGGALHFRVAPDRSARYQREPGPGFTPYSITEIERVSSSPFFPGSVLRLHLWARTPPQWFDGDADELHFPIQDLVTRAEVVQALRNIAAAFDVRQMGLTASRRASPANTLLTVARRLDLCRRLSGTEGAALIGTHQRNLVLYLLLTCFDRLGQPAPYLTFENFLSSNKAKHRALRESAIEDVPPDALAQAHALNQAYLREYGVKNSFFRFLDEVLLPAQYRELLDSLRSGRTLWTTGQPEPMGDHDKRLYLYGLRNAYTHQAEAQPGLTIPFPEEVSATPSAATFYFYEQLNKPTEFEWISFRNWPTVLLDCATWSGAAGASIRRSWPVLALKAS